MHPGEASHGDLGMITADDVIMALSWSGETAELKNLIEYSRRFRIGLVAVTADAASTLGKAADVALGAAAGARGLPAQSRADDLDADAAGTGRCACHCAAGKPRFHRARFAELHPGGRLGALLKFARDVMHSGAAIPLVRAGTRMSDAVLEMSAKGFGCVGITDSDQRLVGIITDGDLRRHMRADLLAARVDDVMTAGPKTIRPDQLVSEALEIINTMKITALFVVDAGRPVGIVHFHDLLRAGAA